MADLGELTERTFAAVLFDLDGTLVDSTPAVERSWRTVAAEFGVPLEFGSFHGIPAAQVVPMILGVENTERGIARLAELEQSDTDGVVPLPGAHDALTGIPAERLAIATSCDTKLAAVRIAAAGLPTPGVVVTADDVPIGKPDPAPYLLAARRLGVDPADCLVVEDAPAGLASAKAAGCAALALLTTHGRDGLAAAGFADTLADVRFVAESGGVRLESRA